VAQPQTFGNIGVNYLLPFLEVAEHVANQQCLDIPGLHPGFLHGFHRRFGKKLNVAPRLGTAEFSFASTHHRYSAHKKSPFTGLNSGNKLPDG
jgi:hypothetical protein